MGLKMVAIGGNNLAKGYKIDVLASAWALCKTSYFNLIGDISERDIVIWANEAVGKKAPSIRDLRDKSLGNGLFLIHLLSSI